MGITPPRISDTSLVLKKVCVNEDSRSETTAACLKDTTNRSGLFLTCGYKYVLQLFNKGTVRIPVSRFKLKLIMEQQSQLYVVVHQGHGIPIQVSEHGNSMPMRTSTCTHAVSQYRVRCQQCFMCVNFSVAKHSHKIYTRWRSSWFIQCTFCCVYR